MEPTEPTKPQEPVTRKKKVEEVRLSKDFAKAHPKTTEAIVKGQSSTSKLGLVLGIVCILGGILLFVLGVTGSINWTGKFLGMETELSNAAPGALLFVVGLFVVIVTRYSVRIEK